MKKIILLFLTCIAYQSYSQLYDGVYKYAKVTVSGGVVTGVDSLVEYDPTVSIDVKNITTMDQNHWNDAYNRIYDYPSYSYLDYLINHVWIPQTTDNLSEGTTNFYFSAARFDSRFNMKTTDNLGEGLVNKYFSNSLARGALSASTPLAYNSSTGTFSIQQASSSQAGYMSSSDWSAFNNKQAALVSGTSIKTVETQSVLGSGNIDLSKSDVGLPNVDNTSDANKPISTAAQAAIDSKQATLVSGSNIKTIGGQTILGSGDIALSALSPGASNATAYGTGTVYTLTTTPAKVDFGTTDPSITLPAAGTYLILANVKIEYVGLLTLGATTANLKLRRTNNTASDLANATTSYNIPVLSLTALTQTAGDADIQPIIYTTANNNDVIEIWGNRGANVSAGSIQIGEASIVAIRIY